MKKLPAVIACLLLSALAFAQSTTAPTTAPTSQPAHTLAAPRNDLPGLGNFAQVSPVLYRGRQPTAEGFVTLQKMGIKTIVNLRRLHDDDDMLGDTGLRYIEIKCNAWHPEEEDVVRFLKIVLDPANQPVFVHCQHGSDRTGMMVAAYRMTVQNWDAADAMAELPNFGFHPIFGDIKKYLATFDVQRVMKKVGETSKRE